MQRFKMFFQNIFVNHVKIAKARSNAYKIYIIPDKIIFAAALKIIYRNIQN